MMARFFSFVAVTLACALAFPRAALSDEPSRVYAAGQVRLGGLYRDTKRVSLNVDSLDNVVFSPETIKGEQGHTMADVGVSIENDTSDQALLDIVGHFVVDAFDPGDLEAGRFNTVMGDIDLRMGYAPDSLTTLRFDLGGHIWQDALAPITRASLGTIKAAADTQMSPSAFLTVSGGLRGGAVAQGDSGNYEEGWGDLSFTHRGAEETAYTILPKQAPEPPRQGGFQFNQETGLYKSKGLFQLQDSSTIAPYAPDPVQEAPFEQLVRERVLSGETLSMAHLGGLIRRYRAGPRSNFRELTAGALHQVRINDTMTLSLNDDLSATTYAAESSALLYNDRIDNRFCLTLGRVDRRGQDAVSAAYAVYRFPNNTLLDFNRITARMTDLREFGGRYRLYSGFMASFDRYDNARPDFPDRRRLDERLVFTVDFTPIQSLSLESRFTQISIDAFTSEFDVPLNESLLGVTYRHRTSKHTWLETGFQYLKRNQHGGASPLVTSSPSAPEDRQESLVFCDTVIDL